MLLLLQLLLFNSLCFNYSLLFRLQCFDAVGWAAGRASGLYKTEWWGAGVVICLELGADLHMAQLMPLTLTVSCFSKIQIGFAFLVPAHLGSPGQRAIKRVFWLGLVLRLGFATICSGHGHLCLAGCRNSAPKVDRLTTTLWLTKPVLTTHCPYKQH